MVVVVVVVVVDGVVVVGAAVVVVPIQPQGFASYRIYGRISKSEFQNKTRNMRVFIFTKRYST